MTRGLIDCRKASGLVVFGIGSAMLPPAAAQIAFDDPQRYFTSTPVAGLTCGDFGWDPLPEVFLTEEFDTLRGYRNDGRGLLLPAGTLFRPPQVQSDLQMADVNADGYPDIVWLESNRADPWEATLQILYGSGDGGAARLVTQHLDSRPRYMAIGDYDNDGDLDFAVISRIQSELTILRNVGPQRFEVAGSVELPRNMNAGLAAGDLDGDGDIDIVALQFEGRYDSTYGLKIYSSAVTILWNDGDGQFSNSRNVHLPIGGSNGHEGPIPEAVELADMDNDGDLDIVVSASPAPSWAMTMFLIQNGQSGEQFITQPPLMIAGIDRPADFDVRDIDLDGDLDILLPGSTPYLRENLGSWEFSNRYLPAPSATGAEDRVVLTDLDGDGLSDIIAGGRDGLFTYKNVTPFSGPLLQHTPLRAGRDASLRVTGAQPGETVTFMYSFAGPGNSVGQSDFGGITLDLLAPIGVAGTAVADAAGEATLTFRLPGNAPLRNVTMQAAIRRGQSGEESVKTPYHTARVQP